MRGRWVTAVVAAVACTACSPVGSSAEQSKADVYVLAGDGVSVNGRAVFFGADPESSIAMFTAEWGAPTGDTGWGEPRAPWGPCGGTTARMVSWGGLHVLFGDMPSRPGLTSWRLDGVDGMPAPAVQVRPRLAEPGPALSLGLLRAEVEQAYPDRIAVSPPEQSADYVADGSAFLVWPLESDTRDTPPLYSSVYGAFSMQAGEPVMFLEAGGICGE